MKPLRLLLLGRGKTGSIVAEVARERGHTVTVLGAAENAGGKALEPGLLGQIDVAIDFTTPGAVLDNIANCALHQTPIVVGTTGWYSNMGLVRQTVEGSGSGLVYGSNFSVGVNIFFEIARAAAAAAGHGYDLRIVERHHTHKKDAPSGTAVFIQKTIAEAGGGEPPIESIREGDTVGTHVIFADSEADSMMLVHDSKSRRGFAQGAVLAAEWLAGRKGVYDFRDIWRELK
jgi:4-hydroxy-tetrahydrodipicolinate reductase